MKQKEKGMVFSIDSPKCQACPLYKDCQNKRMALCAVMEKTANCAENAQYASMTILQPLLKDESGYESMREEIEKRIGEQIFCAFNIRSKK